VDDASDTLYAVNYAGEQQLTGLDDPDPPRSNACSGFGGSGTASGPSLARFDLATSSGNVTYQLDPGAGAIALGGPVAASSMVLDAAGDRAFVVVSGDQLYNCDSGSTTCTAGHRVSVVDLNTASLAREITVGKRPVAFVKGSAGKLYVANYDDGTVTVVDIASESVTAAIGVGRGPATLLANAGRVYVGNSLDGTVSVIDASTDSVVKTVDVDP